MTSEEIATQLRELQDILQMSTTQELDDRRTKVALWQLAEKVGASTQRVFFNNTVSGTKPTCSDAAIPEPIYNIHQALQTASMIDACQTAAKNAELTRDALEETRKAQRTSWIIAIATVIAALAAFGSMVAAWIAVR